MIGNNFRSKETVSEDEVIQLRRRASTSVMKDPRVQLRTIDGLKTAMETLERENKILKEKYDHLFARHQQLALISANVTFIKLIPSVRFHYPR
jgi:hypothetical protein